VTFNVLDGEGGAVDERVIARDSSARHISVRTGCFCNPGAGEGAFEVTVKTLMGAISRGVSTMDGYLKVLGLPTGGAVRASLGLVSNIEDVERLVTFVEETYRDRPPERSGAERSGAERTASPGALLTHHRSRRGPRDRGACSCPRGQRRIRRRATPDAKC
jgi:hypothetical protein